MDPDVQKIGSSHLKYTPKPIAPADCLAPGIITLRGPRRSGKSIAVKQLILTLIQEENWDPNSILWFTAETTRTMANLERIIIGLVKECKPRMLCIDEVSGVRGWQNVIKKLVDTGTLSACVVILTGSSAYDIKTGSERMAGRRGMVANPDRILLPMDFTDFCIQVRRHLPDMNDKDLCQPAMRVGQRQELGWAATFLASPYARFISGHTLVVDGANWQRRSLTNPEVIPIRVQMGRPPFGED